MFALRSKAGQRPKGPKDATFTSERSQLTGSTVKAPHRQDRSSVSQPLGIFEQRYRNTGTC